MNTSDLLKKVRQIEIKTRGLSNHIFAGARLISSAKIKLAKIGPFFIVNFSDFGL